MWRSAGRKRSAWNPDECEAGILQRLSDLAERRLAHRVRIFAQREMRDLQPLKAVPRHRLAASPKIRFSKEPITDCILHAGPRFLMAHQASNRQESIRAPGFEGHPVCIASESVIPTASARPQLPPPRILQTRAECQQKGSEPDPGAATGTASVLNLIGDWTRGSAGRDRLAME